MWAEHKNQGQFLTQRKGTVHFQGSSKVKIICHMERIPHWENLRPHGQRNVYSSPQSDFSTCLHTGSTEAPPPAPTLPLIKAKDIHDPLMSRQPARITAGAASPCPALYFLPGLLLLKGNNFHASATSTGYCSICEPHTPVAFIFSIGY